MSWELQLLLGGTSHCSCMVAEKQQVGDMHSLVEEMDSQSCLRIQEEGLLEHRDEEDAEGVEALKQCWCLAEIESIEGWVNQLDWHSVRIKHTIRIVPRTYQIQQKHMLGKLYEN